MNIRKIHLEFWMCKKSVIPRWESLLPEGARLQAPGIDAIVNTNGGVRLTDYEREIGNTLATLRLVRKRKSLFKYMLCHVDNYLISRKRKAQYLRWIKRIETN